MRLRENAAVEQAGALDRTSPGPLVVTGEELLRDGVAVVVRQEMEPLHTVSRHDGFDDVGLFEDRVAVTPRLAAEAEAEKVERQ